MRTLLRKKHVLAATKSSSPPPFGGLVSTANLVSYWKLNESSGTRLDSFGTNHLTQTNNPTSAVGKIGNGCDLESDGSQFLSYPDLSPLGDENWTYTAWFKRESINSQVAIIGKDNNASDRFYWIGIIPSGDLYALYYPDGARQFYTIQSGYNNTNWHFVVFWHDATVDTINLQVDNGTASATTYDQAWVSHPNIPVLIGARGDISSQTPNPQDYFDGIIDEVSLWRRILTPAERTTLYNSGNGLTF